MDRNLAREVAQFFVLRRCGKKAVVRAGRKKKTKRRRTELDRLVLRAGFSLFGSLVQRYGKNPEFGYTYIATIGQSAINIHTYPEKNLVTAWVITCDGEDDSGGAIQSLATLLKGYFGARSRTSPKRVGEIMIA